ncbi:MAG: hypothetical protein P8R54_28115 [Myxococcota bacterium]|nr:hypothetical protein [Myxococcota bacterium]
MSHKLYISCGSQGGTANAVHGQRRIVVRAGYRGARDLGMPEVEGRTPKLSRLGLVTAHAVVSEGRALKLGSVAVNFAA